MTTLSLKGLTLTNILIYMAIVKRRGRDTLYKQRMCIDELGGIIKIIYFSWVKLNI